ncbi:MAG: type II secretion system secretin GspD [Bdellovibrionales bacterium]|nr:type II secretion system secretin GspD [Bdellovibrionales bacterium]
MKKFTWIIPLIVFGLLLPTWAHGQINESEAAKENAENDSSEKMKEKFAQANPEEINNENFPDLIESFDYPNADITEIVKAIGQLTGKNFIIDPQVRGKITIIAPSQITVADAYRAFLSALAINGFTVVPSGKFLKIRSSRNAQRDSIETFGGAYYPNSDQLITRIIKLKYIQADEVHKQLRVLSSKDGESIPYAPTNTLIVTDYGSNVERIMSIILQLDVPGFEEKMEVMRIRYAKAKDIADLVNRIINKDSSGGSSRFSSGVPRFRRTTKESSNSGSESLSLVIDDSRTNSIIVVGNSAGVQRVRKLVARLDFKLRPEDAGGVYVYYLRHGEAEKIEKILSGLAKESEAKKKSQSTSTRPGPPAEEEETQAIFGGDVKITADKDNNSLIISASKQDYEVVQNLLSKIDIPKDQVYVKAIIMEMAAEKKVSWGINYYTFAPDSNGVGRIGFRGNENPGLTDFTGETGGILGFGSGNLIEVSAGTTKIQVPSLAGLIKFLKTTVGANVLSTPQIMAMNNEEAEIEVGDEVPVGQSNAVTGSTATNSVQREKATIKLTITPFISPERDSVRMKVKQSVKQLSKKKVEATELAKISVATSTRDLKSTIIVNSGDTAVLGGLMQDSESESVTKIPILGDIPILGWLFKSQSIDKTKTNLVVFITPKIIRNEHDNAELLDQKINERITFIQRHMKGYDAHGEAIDNLPRKTKVEAAPEETPNEEPAIESF